MKDYILTIDQGSQSTRVCLIDRHGNIDHIVKRVIQPYFAKEHGWAEQHAEYYWEQICIACQSLWQELPADTYKIKAISMTSQRGSVVNLDAMGNTLRPAITWMDQRKALYPKSIKGIWGALFKLIGASETIEFFRKSAQANWIEQNQNDVWNKTDKFLLLSGYLNYKLTGEFKDSKGNQVGYIPFNYKKLEWANRFSWKWRVIKLKKHMLPELVDVGSILGYLSVDAAKEIGVRVETAVVAAAADKSCEVLGSGCTSTDMACLSLGTTATVNVAFKKYVEAIPLMPAYPAPFKGGYCSEIQTQRGFWLVTWFKEQFASEERSSARKLNIVTEEFFDNFLRQTEPGSNGLIVQPYWEGGVSTPGPEARGSIIGFNSDHKKAHIYRAIIEGLAYSLREGKERIEKQCATKIKRIVVSGGGSQSDEIMKILANVFNLKVERPHTFETSSLGAAICAAQAIGWYSDTETAKQHMTRISKEFEPDLNVAIKYDRIYKDAYLKIYSRLQPIYAKMKRDAH